jgi:signal transduction histidine kinase
MRRRGATWLAFLIAVACFLLSASHRPPVAQEAQKRVLVFHATRRDAPGIALLDAALLGQLSSQLGNRLDYYSEYIDVARFPETAYQDALRDFIRRKYDRQPIDLLMATSDACLDFINRSRQDLFPGVPVVYIGGTTARREANSVGLVASLDFASTVDLIMTLQPETRQVFVVVGGSAYDQYYGQAARRQLQRYDDRVAFTYLSGLPVPELEQRVAHLPAHSVIYYLALTQDPDGRNFPVLEPFDKLAAAANVPIYSWVEFVMSRGIVGGGLLTFDVAAKPAVDLALRVLGGEPPDNIPIADVDVFVNRVDWRQLQRWGINDARVPAGTAVLFREPGVWARYRTYIIGALTLVVLQAALIAGLIVNRANRRRAQAELRLSYDRIQDLAGRLITAQEQERARIARELHDDVGQRIASFSIILGTIKRQLTDAPPVVREDLATLQRETVTLSRDLRVLSHELHPGLLEQLGLIPALQSRCDEVLRETGIRVGLEVSPDLGTVPDDIGLCLYRVAQETLRNVVKHANAKRATVALSRQNGHLTMSVSDDGDGFESMTGARSPGIGLMSLEERVKMLNGTLAIDTSHQPGTTVRVTIPFGERDATTTSAVGG